MQVYYGHTYRIAQLYNLLQWSHCKSLWKKNCLFAQPQAVVL